MDAPERIWFLMSRNLSGDATPEESDELMQVLQEQPVLAQQYELLCRLWQPSEPLEEDTRQNDKIQQILQLSANEQYMQEQQAPVRKFWFKRSYGWAAAIVIVLAGVAIWNFRKQTTLNGHPDEIIAQKGSKTRTILPDGSTVWLNAGSHIYYDKGFSGKYREVTLQGEAFFDIIRQPDKPFIVHAGNLNITVLGTAFNVKSYPEDATTETTLLRGLVKITRRDYEKQTPIVLHPNQKIILPQKLEPAAVKTITVNTVKTVPGQLLILDSNLHENERIETAWIYNRLEFRGDNFEELAKKLER